MSSSNRKRKSFSMIVNITAGGIAGACEALLCQPLDTIKVRMQLSKTKTSPTTSGGLLTTTMSIIRNETPLALYTGLGAVLSGIVPKMAIRFSSFETYRKWLMDNNTGEISTAKTFLAGLGAGATEAIAVVTPVEVVKIRLQAQHYSLTNLRHQNSGYAIYNIVHEQGFSALYRGATLTTLRQSTNQGANFTVYQELKKLSHRLQPESEELPSYQHMLIGLTSGAAGPLFNAPIDTIKTRVQMTRVADGQSSFQQLCHIVDGMWKAEGARSFYKGLTPRVLRVAPGQAVVFAVYERVGAWIERFHR